MTRLRAVSLLLENPRGKNEKRKTNKSKNTEYEPRGRFSPLRYSSKRETARSLVYGRPTVHFSFFFVVLAQITLDFFHVAFSSFKKRRPEALCLRVNTRGYGSA